MFAGIFLLLKKSTRMASDTLLFSSATPCSVNFVETNDFREFVALEILQTLRQILLSITVCRIERFGAASFFFCLIL